MTNWKFGLFGQVNEKSNGGETFSRRLIQVIIREENMKGNAKKLGSSKLILVVLFLIYGLSAVAAKVSAAPGDLDFTFGVQGRQLVTVSTNPITAIHNNTTDIVVQPDGKILVAGYAYIALSPTSGDDFIIVRFNPNGTLDSGFATGGIFRYDFQGGSDELRGIALQPDGKIVAAGEVQIDPFNSNPNTAFAVIRLNPTGAFDSTFGANGLVVTDFLASLDQATEVAIQPDGKILASGWSTRSNTNNGRYDFALVRYNPNGSLDASFGSGGSVFTDFNGFGDLAQSSVLQSDGKSCWRAGFGSIPFRNTISVWLATTRTARSTLRSAAAAK